MANTCLRSPVDIGFGQYGLQTRVKLEERQDLKHRKSGRSLYLYQCSAMGFQSSAKWRSLKYAANGDNYLKLKTVTKSENKIMFTASWNNFLGCFIQTEGTQSEIWDLPSVSVDSEEEVWPHLEDRKAPREECWLCPAEIFKKTYELQKPTDNDHII